MGASTYVKYRNIPGPPQANVNWIPNTGSGIGNICFDKWHHQMFATNHEDGKIYRVKDVSGVGQVSSWYDPFLPDDKVPGFAIRGELLWGIGSYGTSANDVRVVLQQMAF
ncbi:MAG: hypothetical protein IPH77_17480 [Ignavibacteria bacterium]|nr:hypothetical protein [Ignavibacteria bacterium]